MRKHTQIGKPVLLAQGLPVTQVNRNGRQEQNDVIRTDRGDIKEILPLQLEDASLFTANTNPDGAIWTVQAGGQELLTNVPVQKFNYSNDWGNKRDDRIFVKVNDAQTINQRWDYTNFDGRSLISVRTQLILYYTTPEQEHFLRHFKWRKGLGLKRLAEALTFPTATGGTQELTGTIPTGNGKIIGFSLYASGGHVDLVQQTATLYINEVSAIEDISALYFANGSQTEPYIFLAPFEPGSTFRLAVTMTPPTANPVYWYVTFYFDN